MVNKARVLVLTFLAVAVAAIFMATPARVARAQAIAGQLLTNGQVLVGSTGNAPVAATLTGTANQVTVTNGAGSITLSVPTATPFLIGLFTSAQLATLTAPSSGYLAVNISNAQLCISSGTSGAWVVMSTQAASVNGIAATNSCHS